MTESEIVHRCRLRVRESEIDRQQVVFNSRYPEYADVVRPDTRISAAK